MQTLSAALLARVCIATGAQSARVQRRIQSLWSGYGEICRVALTGAREPSVIVKRVSPPALRAGGQDAARSHARKLASYAVEQVWYERYAQRCDERCRVARAWHCEQQGEQRLFVLEDLDAAGYGARRELLSAAGLHACLDWLAHFHSTFMTVKPDGLWEVGTYWHLATRPDELERCVDAALRDGAGRLDARLRRAQFRTLVHGDAKVENFCFAERGDAVAAVDFQYVGGGVGVQDVAYFLSSCLDEAACEARAPALLDRYFETLRAALGRRHPELDGAALESEWRQLYPTAWADFCRFLAGWAPQVRPGRYGERMIALALADGSPTAGGAA